MNDPRPATAPPTRAAEPGQAAPAGILLRMVRRQEIAFALIGAGNTGLGMMLAVAWLAVLDDTWPPAVAVALAYSMGVVVAFVLHRTLVFRVHGHVVRDFLGFLAVNSGGLVLNAVLLQLAVSVGHLPAAPTAVVVMGLVAVASFFGHRHISFLRRPPVEAAGTQGRFTVCLTKLPWTPPC